MEETRLSANEELLRRVAALHLISIPIKDIADSIGVSTKTINRMMKEPRFREIQEEVVAKGLDPQVKKAVAQLGGLLEEAVRVIKEQLRENNLEAAKMVFKAVGIESREEKPNDAVINVILPNAKAPKDIDVEVLDAT